MLENEIPKGDLQIEKVTSFQVQKVVKGGHKKRYLDWLVDKGLTVCRLNDLSRRRRRLLLDEYLLAIGGLYRDHLDLLDGSVGTGLLDHNLLPVGRL